MNEIKDGGPAFPRIGEGLGNPYYDVPGMSLRDYFAGQALITAMCSDNSRTEREARECARQMARRCYEIADAMLKAREAK
jgi:hypothetical protein